eukprot:scaffold467155_cov98-Attheya_sp.AAC.1
MDTWKRVVLFRQSSIAFALCQIRVESILWSSQLDRELQRPIGTNKGIQVRTILTDLQPSISEWDKLVHKFPDISHVDHPVNAGEAGALLAEKYHDLGKENIQVRMMHLSLHHLQPDAVQAFLQDSFDASSHIFIGDLAPNLGGVLFN